MAKTSKIAKNLQRMEIVERHAARRKELKAIISDPASSHESQREAYRQMAKLPRDASPIRVRNRCGISGRPRAYLRKFGMSRIAFRELASRGEIPGIRKSSW
jgi:small subunit ribosomal protein S14